MPGVGGVRIAARSKCLEHREWTGGQIEFLQADGEWSTDRPT